MIDALLYAVRDAIRAAGMRYGIAECEITASGEPPPRFGNVFVAVHGGKARPGPANERNLYELYDFSVTLSMRVTGSVDRVGDQQIARNQLLELARKSGFNAKVEQLRGFLHSNWAITVLRDQIPPSANDNLAAWSEGTVYGFFEPARYQGAEVVALVGSEWTGADPGDTDVCLKAEMRFTNAKRFQPQNTAVGAFT